MTTVIPLIHISTVIVALKTVTLLLGALIAYFAFKAYRRTQAFPLGLLALGFAFVTFGSLSAGVMDLVPRFSRNYVLIAGSGLTVAGFAIIVYSLYTQQ
jgi:hypothetical protein